MINFQEKFFFHYEKEIKQLGLVTTIIIFCEEKQKFNNKYINDTFLNPCKRILTFLKSLNI